MDVFDREFLGALAGTREAQTGRPSRIGKTVWFSPTPDAVPTPGVVEDESPDGLRLAIRDCGSGVLCFVTADALAPF